VVNLKVEMNATIVEARISKDTVLTTGSRGSVTSTTFLSEMFLSISAGAGLGERLRGGETIEGDAPMSMVDGIREFGNFMKNLNALISTTGDDSIVRDITAIIHNAAATVERMIVSSGGDVSATFAYFRSIAAKLDQLVTEFRGSGDKVQTLLNTLNANLPGILADLKQITGNLARITELTTSGQNSVALLLSDTKLYTDIGIIVENFKILSARLRNDPSILLWRDNR